MKDKLVTGVFCLVIGAIFLVNLAMPDQALSYSERRALLQAPELNGKFLFSGDAETEVEAYLLDQFAFRDTFRAAKALSDLKLFFKKDNNGIYVLGDQVFKMNYPLSEASVEKLAQKLNAIYELYLADCNVAVAVIPDKSAYVAVENGYLSYDYYEMTGMLNALLKPERFTYLDLMDQLTLSDYFDTDLHWKQEGLGRVLATIGGHFGVKLPAASLGDDPADWEQEGYRVNHYEPFYGAYYGQAALPALKPDGLNYFTGGMIDGLQVENLDSQITAEEKLVYNPAKLGGIDSYQVFLSGNSPLVILDNPAAKTDRQLIVFRDSYGSSIAPLLAEGYSRVTLVDLRFVGYGSIGKFVDFTDQDVLFLYSAEVVNNSDMLRKN